PARVAEKQLASDQRGILYEVGAFDLPVATTALMALAQLGVAEFTSVRLVFRLRLFLGLFFRIALGLLLRFRRVRRLRLAGFAPLRCLRWRARRLSHDRRRRLWLAAGRQKPSAGDQADE